jgi:hypothetical protein
LLPADAIVPPVLALPLVPALPVPGGLAPSELDVQALDPSATSATTAKCPTWDRFQIMSNHEVQLTLRQE